LPSFNSAAPVLLVAHVGSTLGWYRDVLGFEADAFPSSSDPEFAVLCREGVEIMLQRLAGYVKPDPSPRRAAGVWDVYIRVSGLIELHRELTRTPTAFVSALEQRAYGCTECQLDDPNGYRLVLSEETGAEQ